MRIVDALEVVQVEQHEAEWVAVALAARELALDRLLEVAAIVQLCETIQGHQAIDLFVILRLDVVAGQELEHRAADANLIAVSQEPLADRHLVDEGAVGRVEIAQHPAPCAAHHAGVVAGDVVDVELHVDRGGAAQDQVAILECDALPDLGAQDDHEAGGSGHVLDQRIGGYRRNYGAIGRDASLVYH
jgi:hypothetical protein